MQQIDRVSTTPTYHSTCISFIILRICGSVLGGSRPLKGDLLVIAGATLYGVSNVSEASACSILHLEMQISISIEVNARRGWYNAGVFC